jgi:hypothetical protein
MVGGARGNVGELETKKLPSLDGRGWERVETSDVRYPHLTSGIEGEEPDRHFCQEVLVWSFVRTSCYNDFIWL